MREAFPQDPLFVQAELGRELANLLVVIFNQIAARFRVHTTEAFAQGPYAPADSVARLHDSDAATPSLEFASGGESGEASANDQHRCLGQTLLPMV